MKRTKLYLISFFLGAVSVLIISGCDSKTTEVTPSGQESASNLGTYEKTDSGVIVSLPEGKTKKVRLQVISDSIIRVTATPQDNFDNLPDTLMVVAKPVATEFTVAQVADLIVVKTARTTAEVSLISGAVEFQDAAGAPVLTEVERRHFSPVTEDPGEVDPDSYAIRQEFNRATTEGFYGLGQQQNGLVNYAGADVELTTHNLEIAIPFLVSSRNYGVLWNNTSVTRFGDPTPPQPLDKSLTLFDADGNQGGLTARYYDGDELKLTRVEGDLNYQFLDHGNVYEHPFPNEVKDAKNLRIEWQGSVQSDKSGVHNFLMYSSGYAKLSLGGKLVLDRWRMNWNPWFHNTDIKLTAGEKVPLLLDWTPGGGYFRLLHSAPQVQSEQSELSLASETGKAIDYFFVIGQSADDVISGYRKLTGKASMLPKWAYGFWQSRERYKSQDELLGVLKEYRDRKIPIDNIVLDWFYWPEDAWGSHDFDKKAFPDPKAMVDQVHKANAHIMISVWPKFYPTTDNYKELNAKGYMFNKNIEAKNLDWIAPGYLNAFYDAFSPQARQIFWRQVNEKLNVYGFDAWWLDAVEPDMHSNLSWQKRKDFMTPNALGTGAEYFNAYALPHAETVFNEDKKADPQQRAFILTRSGFAGIQRTGSAIWSGDVVSRWSNLKEQIAAGVGVGLSGMPYWTFDIGGFTPEDRYRYNTSNNASSDVGPTTQMAKSEVAEWQELNLRWFQFGAFVPLFRSHGQNPYREIFNLAEEGTEVYDSLVWYTKLRYRLLPYIYSLAGDAHHRDGTLMRGLVMDFPKDQKAGSISDQYMFGPAILVNPVYEFQARTRDVYLPAGTQWYDFYTGQKYEGGNTITAAAPLNRMPLFVRAGSIIPTGGEKQFVYDNPEEPYTLNVYAGADGHFEIYEDDGKTYDYEKGAWSRIPISYDDASGTLIVGDRQGEFNGMVKDRQLKIRWINGEQKDAVNFDSGVSETVHYTGKSLVVQRPD